MTAEQGHFIALVYVFHCR